MSYTVDEKKLREVFRLAGRVVTVELNRDKDGKSRGHGCVEFDHPVEAVQAISMLNNQTLFDRKMTVRYDKQPGPTQEDLSQLPSRLPEGLGGVGMGLGSGGNPLTEVAKNLPGSSSGNNDGSQGSNGGSAVSVGAAGGSVGGLMGNLGGGGGLGNNTLATSDITPAMASMASMLARQMGMTMGNNAMGNLAGALGNMGGGMGGTYPHGET